jgi:2-oxoglutarate ferredoxin oxidoreductase subunit beta
MGTIESPFNPGELVIGSQGTFFARVVDSNPKLMTDVMYEASQHSGTSIIEVLQNCIIFADKAHAAITAKEVRDDRQLILKHGEPMLFGKDHNKGLRLNGTKLEVITIGENGYTLKDILVHDQYQADSGIHLMLAQMAVPEYPVALGVIRSIKSDTYNNLIDKQIQIAKEKGKIKCVDDLLNSGDVFTIE